MSEAMKLRAEVRPEDRERVGEIVRSTGFFSEEEVAIAVELVDLHLEKGEASGYLFLFAEPAASPGEVLGYTCYGPIPGTRASWDLYWIAVAEGARSRGLGRQLLRATEAGILARGGCQGGARLYAETSSRAQYAPTQQFYLRTGFHQAALLEDFYAPGDGKLTYAKILG